MDPLEILCCANKLDNSGQFCECSDWHIASKLTVHFLAYRSHQDVSRLSFVNMVQRIVAREGCLAVLVALLYLIRHVAPWYRQRDGGLELRIAYFLYVCAFFRIFVVCWPLRVNISFNEVDGD